MADDGVVMERFGGGERRAAERGPGLLSDGVAGLVRDHADADDGGTGVLLPWRCCWRGLGCMEC
jgi:hypothetical protein